MTSHILYWAIQESVSVDLNSNTLSTSLVCVRGMLHEPGISHGANHVGMYAQSGLRHSPPDVMSQQARTYRLAEWHCDMSPVKHVCMLLGVCCNLQYEHG